MLAKLRDFVAYPGCDRVLEVNELKEKARSLYTILISYCRRVGQAASTGTGSLLLALPVPTLSPDHQNQIRPKLLTVLSPAFLLINLTLLFFFFFCFSRTWCSSLMTVMLWKFLFHLPLSTPSLRAKSQLTQKLYLGKFQGDQKSKYVYMQSITLTTKIFFKHTSNIISDLPIFLCLGRKWIACLAYLLSC